MSITKKLNFLLFLLFSSINLSFANTDLMSGLLFSPERIVYLESENKGAMTTLENANKEVALVQASVITADKKTLKPSFNKDNNSASEIFLITPPLHRLDSGVRHSWRIQRISDGNLPNDRESVFFVVLKIIPEGSSKDKPGSEFIVAPTLYFKMLYRPKAIEKLSIDKEVENIRFSKNKNKLIIKNPSALSMTLTSLSIGDYKVPSELIDDSILPFGEMHIDIPQSASGQVTWQVLNEYGLITRLSIGVLDENIS